MQSQHTFWGAHKKPWWYWSQISQKRQGLNCQGERPCTDGHIQLWTTIPASCRNTLLWSLGIFLTKLFFKNHLGKQKHAQNGHPSSKNIFSVPCNTSKNVVFRGNHCLLVHTHPRSHLQRLQRIMTRHTRKHTVPKRWFWRNQRCIVFLWVGQTPQNICWSSRTLILVLQSGYMGVVTAIRQKQHCMLMWNYRLQIPMLHFLISLPSLFSPPCLPKIITRDTPNNPRSPAVSNIVVTKLHFTFNHMVPLLIFNITWKKLDWRPNTTASAQARVLIAYSTSNTLCAWIFFYLYIDYCIFPQLGIFWAQRTLYMWGMSKGNYTVR